MMQRDYIKTFIPNTPFLFPLKTEKPYDFLMFLGDGERVH